MVEGPDEFFRARIRGVKGRKWAAVSIEFKAAVDDISFGIDRACGVDDERARLRHHEFTPRVEARFERQREHWTQVDQFNDPAPGHAMRGIADLYADLVDPVAQRAAVRVVIAVHRKRRSLLRSAFPGSPEPVQLANRSPSTVLVHLKVNGSLSMSHDVLASKNTSPLDGKVVSSSGDVQFTIGAWFDKGGRNTPWWHRQRAPRRCLKHHRRRR